VHAGRLLDFNAQIAAMTSITISPLSHDQDAYRKRAQRARSLGLYFARIYITLLMLQLGALLCVFDTYSTAPLIVGVTWMTFVPALTAATALTKPDVREAVLDLLPCRWASRSRQQASIAPHPA
jgi:hypothetical protein